MSGLASIACEFRWTASRATNTPGGGEARLGALPDQAAFEFRQRAKHVTNKPTSRGRRVEGFGQGAETDTFQAQFLRGARARRFR
jgi:hypothetical protein